MGYSVQRGDEAWVASRRSVYENQSGSGRPDLAVWGYVVGRNIELVPNERIVHAWRTLDWIPGIYSIVKFQLSEQSAGTKVILEHAASQQDNRNTLQRDGRRTI